MFVPELGNEIPAGGQISLTTEHQPVIVLENYPGLVDATSDETVAAELKASKAKGKK